MPSGDTSQGALWCALTMFFFDSNFTIYLIPIIAYGRVYFRCHWIGDTIAGAFLGIGIAAIGYFNFPKYADLVYYFMPGFIQNISPSSS